MPTGRPVNPAEDPMRNCNIRLRPSVVPHVKKIVDTWNAGRERREFITISDVYREAIDAVLRQRVMPTLGPPLKHDGKQTSVRLSGSTLRRLNYIHDAQSRTLAHDRMVGLIIEYGLLLIEERVKSGEAPLCKHLVTVALTIEETEKIDTIIALESKLAGSELLPMSREEALHYMLKSWSPIT